MSEFEFDEDGKVKKKSLGIVEHVHKILKVENGNGEDKDLSKEELKEKLEQRETELGAIAMKAFEKEASAMKKILKKKYGFEPVIDNPSTLEKYKKEYKSDESDNSGSVSLGEKGSDSIPLYQPDKSGYKTGKDVIGAVYDEIERLTFKKDFGKGLKESEAKALQKLELRRNKLWRKVSEGERKRGKSTRFEAFKCPICGSFVAGHMCQKCGYVYGSKVDEAKKEQYQLGEQ